MDEQRAEALVQRYRHRIYTVSRYCLGRGEDAEDVTQEVLVRLWRNADKVDAGRLDAWVTRVTRNACTDVIRKRTRRRKVMAQGIEEEMMAEAPDTKPTPHRHAEHTDLREGIEQALAMLTEPYRMIVVLREIQQKSYAEISEALEMPLSRVKVYLHRGRRMLRDRLCERVTNGEI